MLIPSHLYLLTQHLTAIGQVYAGWTMHVWTDGWLDGEILGPSLSGLQLKGRVTTCEETRDPLH